MRYRTISAVIIILVSDDALEKEFLAHLVFIYSPPLFRLLPTARRLGAIAGLNTYANSDNMRSPPSARFFLAFYDTFSPKATCQAGNGSWLRSTTVPSTLRPRSFVTSPQKYQKESLRPQTHYDIFPATLQAGPPPKGPFTIDTRQLRNEFLQLQAKAHPDLHHGQDKARAEGLSSLINEAYKTLQNPLLRAQYLLSLRGIEVAEDETAKVEDPDLLMEVLETREMIEEAQSEGELVPLKQENEGRIESSVRTLEEAFKKDNMEMAKSEAVRLRYWVNIKESLDGWEKGKPVVLVH